MAARTAGRKGRVWERNSKAAIADYGGICVICGHPGAGDGHHVPPRDVILALGGDPNDQRFIRPAHGSKSRCPVCGRCCNQSVGTRPAHPRSNNSRDW